jgi:hypothetical protein
MSWSTTNELNFIDKLGTGRFSKSDRVLSKTRIELLAGYIRGNEQRREWGTIDRRAVMSHAYATLASERQGEGR